MKVGTLQCRSGNLGNGAFSLNILGFEFRCSVGNAVLNTVVVALRYAKEAWMELSDSTRVEFIEDTIGAPRDENNDLTKCAVNTCLFLLVHWH